MTTLRTKSGLPVEDTNPLPIALRDGNGQALDYVSAAPTRQSLLDPSDLSRTIVNTASSGDNTIVAAVSGQTTRVHRMRLYSVSAITIIVKRGSTTLETILIAAGGWFSLEFSERAHYKTGNNEAFILNLSGATQVHGVVEYVTSV